MVTERIFQKVRSFRTWWQGLNLFGQKLPVILASLLFVILVFHVFFEVKDSSIILKNPIQAIISDGVRNLGLLLAASIGWFFLYWRAKTADQGIAVERFTRAIEQIAHEKPYVRVGSIRSLEKIAYTHEEERMEIAHILVSFIRTRAAKKSEEIKLTKEEDFHAYREERLDIEVAVNALARIASKLKKQKQSPRKEDEKYYLFNLENLDLRGLRLEGADLSKFNLGWSDFSGAWLRRTNFAGALLFKSSRMIISGGAIFSRAHLDHANFTNAFLNHAIFAYADLSSAKFDNTTLQGVNLDGSLVNDTHFERSGHLTQEQINQAYYRGSPPHLPDGLELPPKEPYNRSQHIF